MAKLSAATIRALTLRELKAHSRPGVEITDEVTATFEDLDMDSLDIVAFAYDVESEITGFNGDEMAWTVRTTLGQALADIQKQHLRSHQ